ncbi:MAG: succinate dehydrogenase [Deltaproteobacteria bacterium]|nr:succinate dehydrogenase [Deltaproteobacteria bacterium]MBI3387919.1 succinate dehydrogenase [Deltaproteobacteria bacterium]
MLAQSGELRRTGFAATERRDKWWAAPLGQGLMLGVLITYANWAAYQGSNYQIGGYLSPLYSPLITAPWFPFPPSFIILIPPVLFRATCYYYRKAYYRSYLLDPPACAVSEFRGAGYRGETAFPLILQNLHRYLFYLTAFYLIFLWHDVVNATIFDGAFGIGVGTVVILANTTALTLYSFSCHSLRHLVGGNLDCFSSCALNRARHQGWRVASLLNERHMVFAWASFVTVCGSDLYIRLVASGVIKDLRLL